MKTLICDCNRSMPLDPPTMASLRQALTKTPGASAEGLDTVHTLLCRREAGAFQRAAKSGDELAVACTQESRLFVELNAETEGAPSIAERPIRFFNIRETGGWSKDARAAAPKLAALIAAAQLADPDPVATVNYRSGGRCLVIGAADVAERAAGMLADRLDVSVLIDGGGGGVPQRRERAVYAGRLRRIGGRLGAFDVEWESGNPIDLDLCTRCNACIAACPEGAIDFAYQIDLDRCRSHRDCVKACDAAGAIDFDRAVRTVAERFDLVLDLRAEPAFTQHAPPQGYWHAGSDERRLVEAMLKLRELAGEFEKPRFFHYKPKLCAHSRNERVGCSACIEVCSARAIASQATRGGGVRVEPHLCVGCGACTTVCPSGALAYGYPDAPYQGRRLRTTLTAYREAGGRDAALLLHSEGAGARLVDELGRAARVDPQVHGVPARVLPLALWHTASVGLDLWLAAKAYGASQVWVLLTDEEAPEYRSALAEQAALANAILAGLGFAGEHVRLITARDARDLGAFDLALRAPAAQTIRAPASFAVQADKRATLDLALDHLIAQAGAVAETIELPRAGAPFGAVVVDPDKCTLCLSCVGACPEGALADNPERLQLRFIERNCVQCALCERTCPEAAIALQPRLWLADGGKARKQPRVLLEAEPFRCVRCGKPFGTLKAIENMALKLAGHPMFQGAAAERLNMCSDCRIIDIHTHSDDLRFTVL
ncbi:MAG: 4Fe-4S dicluster domain-containing protein [Burkholderiales bacterium]|nr:MAG: 4Fe-4S dicluster domain-containing protein [Burkholderiales bacterium]